MNAPGARRWWALGALTLCVLAVGLDGTVLSVALPTLATDLHASTADLQWFVSGYTLVLAAALLPGGLLGDRYGRKRVLLGASALFGAGSLACAYAPSPGTVGVRRHRGGGLGARADLPARADGHGRAVTGRASGVRRGRRGPTMIDERSGYAKSCPSEAADCLHARSGWQVPEDTGPSEVHVGAGRDGTRPPQREGGRQRRFKWDTAGELKHGIGRTDAELIEAGPACSTTTAGTTSCGALPRPISGCPRT